MREIKFKDFIKLQRGFDLPRKDMSKGVYPVVGSTSIIGWHNEYKQEPPGVVTGRSGSLGVVQYIKERYWPHNTSLWVKDFKGNVPRYVYYFLQNFPLAHFNSGVGVPTLNRNDLDNYQISIHEYKDQLKVSSVFSAYDDLIELNEQRIKILEEMARLIYKEWFVKLRFPGYEKANMVESELGMIPEGWGVRKVEEVVERIHPGKLYDSNTVKKLGKVPVLDQGRSRIIGYHDDEPSVKATEDDPVIVFANHTCYQNLILFPFSAIQNVLPFIPNKANYRNIFWLFWATKGLVKFNDYKGHWPEFMNKNLIVPPPIICDEFGNVVKSIEIEKYKLQQQNSILRQTRNMLLPKLIRGEIEL